MLNGNKIKLYCIGFVMLGLFTLVIILAVVKSFHKVRMEDNDNRTLVIPSRIGGSLSRRDPPLLTIEKIEWLFQIEVAIPTTGELRTWCLRYDANTPTKGKWTQLSKSMNLIRCEQEASRWYHVFKLGEPNEKEMQEMYIRIRKLSERNLE